MEKIITTRIPEDYLIELKKIAEKENIDVSTVIRKFLAKAMQEWRKNYAIENYKKGDFSFGQAAKFAGISAWDFPELLKSRKIPLNLDENDFEDELKTLKKLK